MREEYCDKWHSKHKQHFSKLLLFFFRLRNFTLQQKRQQVHIPIGDWFILHSAQF